MINLSCHCWIFRLFQALQILPYFPWFEPALVFWRTEGFLAQAPIFAIARSLASPAISHIYFSMIYFVEKIIISSGLCFLFFLSHNWKYLVCIRRVVACLYSNRSAIVHCIFRRFSAKSSWVPWIFQKLSWIPRGYWYVAYLLAVISVFTQNVVNIQRTYFSIDMKLFTYLDMGPFENDNK